MDEGDKEVIEFLKYALSHIENRIVIVDNKASILIGVQGIFFAIFTYIINDVFMARNQLCARIVLGGAFAIFIITIVLLLQTIRPSKNILGSGIDLNDMEVHDYILWFDDKFPKRAADYLQKTNTLDLSKIKKNYQKAHFIVLQLLRKKYKYYKWATVGMKLLVLWTAIGITILSILNC